MFLELTRIRVFAVPILLVLATAFLFDRYVLALVGAICVFMGVLIGEVLVQTVRGPERRLTRRLWLLALPFAQGAWLSAAVTIVIYYRWIRPDYGYVYQPWARAWGEITSEESTVFYVAAAAGGLIGLVIWSWRWNRLCALLGMPDSVRVGAALRRARWFLHVVPLAFVALMLTGWLLMKLLNLLLDLFPSLYS